MQSRKFFLLVFVTLNHDVFLF